MIRLSIYITLAILMSLGAVWLADHPGSLQLNWQGWEVRMSMAIFSLLVVAYTVALWLLFKLYRWFRTDNPLRSPKRLESRRQKGLAQLDQAWSALAIDDRDSASKLGKKALALLPKETGPLRLMLAVTRGKDQQKYLDQLADNPDTRLAALKSRLDREGDALPILQEMQQLNPENPWISTRLFEFHTRRGTWDAARAELKKLAKTIDAVAQKRLSAVLCYAQALDADLANQATAARDFAEQALKNDPALTPAALLLARHHLAQDDTAKARKIIENAWKVSPHPELGQFYLQIDPLDSPSEKFRRVQKLTRLNSDHPYSRHFLAAIALDTENWAEARGALDRLTTDGQETRETFHLLARLEMLQKQDKKAADRYMTRATGAPADPAWRCDSCAAPSDKFIPLCPTCQDFGRIRWQGAP